MYGCTICFAIGVKGLSAGVVGFSVLITVVEWLGRVAYTLEGFYLFFFLSGSDGSDSVSLPCTERGCWWYRWEPIHVHQSW